MEYDAVIVGSGPNGLGAALVLARAGLKVKVYEAAAKPGGGVSSAELTEPGFLHDVCSAVHPMGYASPFFRTLPLAEHGLRWIFPPAFAAHPLDEQPAVVMKTGADGLEEELGAADAVRYEKLIRPFAGRADDFLREILAPLHIPRDPFLLMRFGCSALQSAQQLSSRTFKEERAKAFFAGMAAHSLLPLTAPLSSAAAIALGAVGRAFGWPVPAGGSQAIANALVSLLRASGGELEMNTLVRTVEELPTAQAYIFDVGAAQLAEICAARLPASYIAKLKRFKNGPGIFKVDYALSQPVPWRDLRCRNAATIHLGGSFAEIAAAEQDTADGGHPQRPFVLAAQPSLFDALRAPAGKHTLWAYCHVPYASHVDMSPHIEAQIERFAPGFRDVVLAKHVISPADLARRNPNCPGGDISGGAMTWRQLFFRPVPAVTPYRTPARGIYICSASTPPGPGVHGMCGFHAALAVLDDLRS